MKIMKKIVKSKVFIFVVTAITFSSISVYAAGRYYASQIDYEPENSNFNVTNMEQALNQLYTTQNTTVNSLNSQITAKDQTISNLQSQLNGISTTECIKGTFTASSACGTSSGCLIENQFNPTFLYLVGNNTSYGWQCSLYYNKNVNPTKLFSACSDNDGGVSDNISDRIRVSGNSVYFKNAEYDDFKSGNLLYIACR